jgi:hypothetical protein
VLQVSRSFTFPRTRVRQEGWIVLYVRDTALLPEPAFQPPSLASPEKPHELGFNQFWLNHTRLALADQESVAFPYAALLPTCYTPPSLSGFKPCGGDKLGVQ